MRRPVLIVLLLALTPTPVPAQRIDWDGRGTGTDVRIDSIRRGSSSESSSSSSGRSGSDSESVYIPPAPPDPLPSLVGEYQNLRGWFSGSFFSDAPGFVQPSNMTELYWALAALRDYANGRLRGLRTRKSELEERYRVLQEQQARNNDFSAELRTEIAGLEGDIARYGNEAREIESKISSQAASTTQVTALVGRIEEETKATKAGVFVKLNEAERRGVLLPPSSYRRPPEPPPPIYSRAGEYNFGADAQTPQLAVPLRPAMLAPSAAAPYLARAFTPQLAAPFAPRRAPVSQQEVQEKAAEIRNTMPLIVAANEALKAVYQRSVEQERLAAASSSAVEALRGRAEALRSERDKSGGVVSEAKARLDDAVGAYRRERERLPLRCLEQAFWKYADKNVAGLVEIRESILKSKGLIEKSQKLAKGDATDVYINIDIPESLEKVLPGVDVKGLRRVKKVLNHALEMNKDTLRIIERAPGALAYNLENPEQLKEEVEEVVRRFQLNLADTLSIVPRPLRRFFEGNKENKEP